MMSSCGAQKNTSRCFGYSSLRLTANRKVHGIGDETQVMCALMQSFSPLKISACSDDNLRLEHHVRESPTAI